AFHLFPIPKLRMQEPQEIPAPEAFDRLAGVSFLHQQEDLVGKAWPGEARNHVCCGCPPEKLACLQLESKAEPLHETDRAKYSGWIVDKASSMQHANQLGLKVTLAAIRIMKLPEFFGVKL